MRRLGVKLEEEGAEEAVNGEQRRVDGGRRTDSRFRIWDFGEAEEREWRKGRKKEWGTEDGGPR